MKYSVDYINVGGVKRRKRERDIFR
jgi:hypothetical protein